MTTPLRRISIFAFVLLFAVSALAQAGGNNKNKKNKGNKNKPPPANDTQGGQDTGQSGVDPQALREVESRLLAYATQAARDRLAGVLDENDPKCLVALGGVLEQEKAYSQAEQKLRRAAELAPESADPWIRLGRTYLHQERQADARAAFQEAARRAQAQVNGNANDPQAWLMLGVAQRQLGQLPAADQSLQRAHDLDPGDPVALFELGALRVEEQKWQPAVDLLTQALSKSSEIAYAYFYRGQAASKINRKDLLVADFERFIAMAPDAPEAAAAARIVASVRR